MARIEFLLAAVIFSSFVFAFGADPLSTPTPSKDKLHFYPTPDWAHLKPGIDYVKNKILVVTKYNLGGSEEKRFRQKLSAYGKVSFYDLKGLHMKMYEIVLTNGDSERQAIEELHKDPAVQSADLDGIKHFN